MGKMTVAQVKKELPNVKLKIGKRVTTGKVTGRMNKFASVHEFGKLGTVYKFSWEAVARSVNSGRPLKV